MQRQEIRTLRSWFQRNALGKPAAKKPQQAEHVEQRLPQKDGSRIWICPRPHAVGDFDLVDAEARGPSPSPAQNE